MACQICYFLCLSKRVFFRLRNFLSLEFMSAFSMLFQSSIDLNENVHPLQYLLYMGQHRFSLLKRVFLE